MSLCASWGPCYGNNLRDLRVEVETLLPRFGPYLEWVCRVKLSTEDTDILRDQGSSADQMIVCICWQAYMETGEDSVGQEYEDEEELFEFDDSFADRRWDSTLLSMQPSLALMPRLTAALTLLNLQVRHSASNAMHRTSHSCTIPQIRNFRTYV